MKVLEFGDSAVTEILAKFSKAFLANNDAYGFFENIGDLVVTGPTRVYVNAFQVILIDRADWVGCGNLHFSLAIVGRAVSWNMSGSGEFPDPDRILALRLLS